MQNSSAGCRAAAGDGDLQGVKAFQFPFRAKPKMITDSRGHGNIHAPRCDKVVLDYYAGYYPDD